MSNNGIVNIEIGTAKIKKIPYYTRKFEYRGCKVYNNGV